MRTTDFKERLKQYAAPIALTQPTRSPEEERFVPYSELRQHGIPYTRVHLRRLAARGLFPLPVLLSPNRVAWTLSALEQWKATRPTQAA